MPLGNWSELKHAERIKILKNQNDDEVIADYLPPDTRRDEFERHLREQRELWEPDKVAVMGEMGNAPTKDSTIGAWRDLNRSEALLELIDNSIDAWKRRKDKYPKYTARSLRVYIDIDPDRKVLIYEDNAGGIPVDALQNLVIPGYSETSDEDATIGSYKTGGKKAIFKLATEAKIQSRYWSHAGTSDDTYEVHLDKDWMNDPTLYKFPYAKVENTGEVEVGQTIYHFRLREDNIPNVTPWYEDEDTLNDLKTEIIRAYTLLLLRDPNIEIYFIGDRKNPLRPSSDLYVFTGAKSKDVDLLPQRVEFICPVELQEKRYEIRIEIVLGCRTTTASRRGDDAAGIDLYGNNRLFVANELDHVTKWFKFPTGNVRQYIRGFINIKGPNILIPWDTHKRHMNVDREVITILRTNPLIKDFMKAWKEVYSAVSSAKDQQGIIKERLEPWRDEAKNDLNIPHSDTVSTAPRGRRGRVLQIHKPEFPASKTNSKPESIEIKFSVTKAEYRNLLSKYRVASSDTDAKKLLSDAVKETALALE